MQIKYDRNGYRSSLFNTEPDVCMVCHRGIHTDRHEIFPNSNRTNSKRYGMWINVCRECHGKIHAESEGRFKYLKEEGQRLFEEEYPNESFLKIFGRNYL
jgi:hypothetical protein